MTENTNSDPIIEPQDFNKVQLDVYRDAEKPVAKDIRFDIASETTIAANTIEVVNLLSEKALRFDDVVDDINTTSEFYLNKDKLLEGISQDDYDEYVNHLLENHVLFISSKDIKKNKTLAFNIFSKSFRTKHAFKSLKFNSNTDKSYGLSDLIPVLEDKKELLFFGDLSSYIQYPSQNAFLESLTLQSHTNCIHKLKERNIFLILVTSHAKGCEITNLGNDSYHDHIVWHIGNYKSNESELHSIEKNLEEYNYIEKLVLFIGLNFDKLTFRDFDSLVKLLLSHSTATEKIAVDTYKNFDDGAKKVKLISEEELIDVWKSNQDKIFNRCYLEGSKEGGETFVVDLKYPELKPQVSELFKKKYHFFWLSQCAILEESRLIFNPGISENIASGVINLIIESLADDQSYYDEIWFLDLIGDINYSDGQEYQLRGESAKEQLTNLFFDIENRKEVIYFFYSRLGNILKKMLQKSLRLKAEDFLQSLITFGLQEQLFILVKILSPSPDFNKFYWVKQLIERGSATIKNNVYRWLIDIAAAKYPEETWVAVKSWLPLNKKIANYSPSNHYSSFFIVHFYINEIKRFPIEKYGEWPSRFSAFSSFKEDPEKCKQHITQLLQQYLYEGTSYQFNSDNVQLLHLITLEQLALVWSSNKSVRDFLHIDADNFLDVSCLSFTPNFYTLLGDLLETWIHIIKGFSNKPGEDAESLAGFIISILIRETLSKTDILNNITRHWEKKAGEYYKQIKRLQAEKSKLQKPGTEDTAAMTGFERSLLNRSLNMTFIFEILNTQLKIITHEQQDAKAK